MKPQTGPLPTRARASGLKKLPSLDSFRVTRCLPSLQGLEAATLTAGPILAHSLNFSLTIRGAQRYFMGIGSSLV